MRLLDRSGRSFRVEKVPLCYMTDFAHGRAPRRGRSSKARSASSTSSTTSRPCGRRTGSTSTRQGCASCSLRTICGGLFDRGQAYDPGELAPVFVPLEPIVRRVMTDGQDPATASSRFDYAAWLRAHEARRAQPRRPRDADLPPQVERGEGPTVGLVTEESLKRFAAKRRAEAKLAEKLGVAQEPGERAPKAGR
jgi:hypothetical protein